MSRDPSVVFLRTKAGRIHKAVRLDGQLKVDERCNLDDAPGEEQEITFTELERAQPRDLCGQPGCFPLVKPDAELGE